MCDRGVTTRAWCPLGHTPPSDFLAGQPVWWTQRYEVGHSCDWRFSYCEHTHTSFALCEAFVFSFR